MAPARVGSISAVDIVNYCYSGKSKEKVMKLIRSQGGLYDHLQTYDAREVVKRIKKGDKYAKNIYDALINNNAMEYTGVPVWNETMLYDSI